MGPEVNIDLIKELVSVPFRNVRNRIELLDQFEAVFKGIIGDGKLCRTCTKDREFAYLKLKKYLSENVENEI
jgi:hypothetical protein